MTTINDDLEDRKRRFGEGYVDANGTITAPFMDQNKEHPRKEYSGQSGVNKGARSGTTHQIYTGGGIEGVNVNPHTGPSVYPKVDIKETSSGHVLEFNDTPGGERVLLKHQSGTGIDIRPNGNIIVSTTNNKIEIVAGTSDVIVEGEANLTYNGNLTLNVEGTYTVNCGRYDVTTRGDHTHNIKGGRSVSVGKSDKLKVAGGLIEQVGKFVNKTYLSGLYQAVKGNNNQVTQGNLDINASGNTTITAEGETIVSSPDINMAAESISVFGDTGTIGGENVIMYNYNMHTGHSVWADTVNVGDGKVTAKEFIGSLTGNATTATEAGKAGTAGSLGASGSAGTAETSSIQDDSKATALPNAALLSIYLNKSAKGVRKVLIDVGDYIKNSLLQKDHSPDEIAEKLAEDVNKDNNEFTTRAVADGKLNPKWSSKAPSGGVGRVIPQGPTCRRPNASTSLGNVGSSNKTFRLPEATSLSKREPKIVTSTIAAIESAEKVVDAPKKSSSTNAAPEKSNANAKAEEVKKTTAKTVKKPTDMLKNTSHLSQHFELIPGVTTTKFLRGNNIPGSWSVEEQKQLFRNWTVHAQILKAFNKLDRWKNYQLRIEKGFYETDPNGIVSATNPKELAKEELTKGGALYLRQRGNLVIYALYGQDGTIDADNTFEACVDIKENFGDLFAKLRLNYDEFHPSGILRANIWLTIGDVTSDGTVGNNSQGGSGQLATYYNNNIHSATNLVEILPEGEQAPEEEDTKTEEQKINDKKQRFEDQTLAKTYTARSVAEQGIARLNSNRLFPDRQYDIEAVGEGWKIVKVG